MKHTDTIYTTFLGGTISSAAYLFGGLDHLLLSFAILLVCDFILGVLAGAGELGISSKRAYKGLAKKAGMAIMIIVANVADNVTGNGGHFLRNAMIMFLIATEGISIVENLGRLGITVPDFLKNTFEQFKDKGEGK